MSFVVRLAQPGDAQALLGIYAPFVLQTAATFETVVPSLKDFENRVQTIMTTHPWLVAIHDDKSVLGYAYAGPHRARAAYAWSTETSVYLGEQARGKGVARQLYQTLIRLLRHQGFANAYAGISLPNDDSYRFHKRLGFSDIGTFKNVGFKMGLWHDVAWLHFPLLEASKNSIQEPKKTAEILHDDAFSELL